jgi:16S rRNA (uracil1498-N3)-methyltransferase
MRFFLEEAAGTGDVVELSATDSRHLSRVLRREVGSQIIVVSANKVFNAELVEVGEVVRARLLDELEAYSEAPLELILLQGLAKGERMEIVIQKAVELGVSRLIPIACERSVVRLDVKKAAAKVERWQKIADAAAKQCGRTRLVEVAPVQGLAEALKSLPEGCRVIMPWEEADGLTVGCSLKAALAGEAPAAAALIIGPEGGLAAHEAELAKAAGAELVTLGRRILRTETAAIAALAIVMYQWGDLSGEPLN